MNSKVKGPVAVVTGSSRGIGKSIRRKLIDNGYCVIGVYRSRTTNETDKKCDIRKEKEVVSLVEEIIDEYGKIDVLINNAGITSSSDITKTQLKDWNNVIATNLTGPFLLCKHILPYMKSEGYGKVVNVSSIAARSFSKTSSVEYTASKYGLIGLTKQLAYQYGKYAININCICPSQTNTEMLIDSVSSEMIDDLEKTIPLGKIANPDQVANVVSFLCSSESSYIHGAVIDINGGQI